jgi:hypothetical protein
MERNTVSPRIDTLTDVLAAAGFSLEIAPRIGAGVDRSLIHAALRRSPEERVRTAAIAARNLSKYLEAVDGGRGRLRS